MSRDQMICLIKLNNQYDCVVVGRCRWLVVAGSARLPDWETERGSEDCEQYRGEVRGPTHQHQVSPPAALCWHRRTRPASLPSLQLVGPRPMSSSEQQSAVNINFIQASNMQNWVLSIEYPAIIFTAAPGVAHSDWAWYWPATLLVILLQNTHQLNKDQTAKPTR